jgi:DNA-binding LytR/AlgR family response regulator
MHREAPCAEVVLVVPRDAPVGVPHGGERKGREILLGADHAGMMTASREHGIGPVGRQGAETVDAVLRHRPELLFLNIQMPGGNGFEVLSKLPPEMMPLIVFATAYDRYSLQAFEVHAADYLLKPFSDRWFRSALAHAKDRLRQREAPRGQPAAHVATDRLAIRTAHGVLMLAVGDIEWIEARGDYAGIHSGARTDLARESLSSLESRLGPTRFVRIHRSAIVNLAQVREFKPDPSGAALTIENRLGDNLAVKIGALGL